MDRNGTNNDAWAGAGPASTSTVGRTELTVDELVQHLINYRDAALLFRKYPGLEPDAVREAIDRAASHGDREVTIDLAKSL